MSQVIAVGYGIARRRGRTKHDGQLEIDGGRRRGYARGKRFRRPVLRAVLALQLAAVAARPAVAATLAPGSALPAISLEDQHDVKATVGHEVRIVVLSRDMAAGDIVKDSLAGMDQAALDLRGAVYVADISGMPSLIASMFAIPKMRERSYRILLDRDGAATRDFPYAEGRPTVLVLDEGKIVRVAQPASGDQLRQLLQPQP